MSLTNTTFAPLFEGILQNRMPLTSLFFTFHFHQECRDWRYHSDLLSGKKEEHSSFSLLPSHFIEANDSFAALIVLSSILYVSDVAKNQLSNGEGGR